MSQPSCQFHSNQTVETDPEIEIQEKRRKVHEQALDIMVTANGFFSTAIFIGMNGTVTALPGIHANCVAGDDIGRQLLLFEILSFGFFLASTLIGLGTRIRIIHLQETNRTNPKGLPKIRSYQRVMLLSMFFSFLGSLFLLLSIIHLIQFKFGLLSCANSPLSWVLLLVLAPCVGCSLFIYIEALVKAIKSLGKPEP